MSAIYFHPLTPASISYKDDHSPLVCESTKPGILRFFMGSGAFEPNSSFPMNVTCCRLLPQQGLLYSLFYPLFLKLV